MADRTPQIPEVPKTPADPARVFALLEADFETIDTPLDEVVAQVDANPDDPALLDWYAHALYAHKKFEEALTVYERLLKREPSNVQWLLYRANAQYVLGQREKARDGWMEILEYSPDSRVGRRALGLLRGEEIPEEIAPQPPSPPPPAVQRLAEGPVQKGIAIDAGREKRPIGPWLALAAALAGVAALFVIRGAPDQPVAVVAPSPSVTAVPELPPAVGTQARLKRRRALASRSAPPPPDPAKTQQESDLQRNSGLLIALLVGGVLAYSWGSSPPRRR